ncbi:MAG: adenosyl-hopene transferase HpnH [Planctomycetes bacterium]|jgi:hopanoid biosynthesis associated radical SAM protein HpnH|nr:adenosyl-hopene transferase HpnH [Planctomycetota bacterium]MCL4730206.1 adenosyl-hopene transferase HpnH [Planctomycetota bacterium]
MAVPLSQMWAVASYVLRQRVARRRHYATVLMLEPLLRCNLACAGCGKIQYPAHVLKKEMAVADALAAVEECGAPIISIPGGEPMMYSHIGELVRELVARKKYIYLCTNALLLKQRLEEGVFSPSKFLTFSVHMDGDRDAHDFAVCREGTYDKAYEAIKLAVSLGYRVTTNTTLFNHVDVARTRRFFDEMMALGVESMTVSPGYSYQKAPDQHGFLKRENTYQLFRSLLENPRKHWQFNQSPLFMQFLMGKLHLECTPWGNPCYTLFGWQRPCYLLQEGYARTFRELIETTDWDSYGRASGNPKCANCMVHCGYEPTAVHETFNSLGGFLKTVAATFAGVPDSARGHNITPPPVTRRVTTGEAAPDAPELERALRDAVDFRGDVRITTRDGGVHEGYLFNVSDDLVEYFPSREAGVAALRRADVTGVERVGRDFADGKSWEAWVRKYHEQKAARAAGEKVETIGIFSEPL